MPTLRFKVGDYLDVTDPVARFIAGLGMISNDWMRMFAQMGSIPDYVPDADALRVLSFRLQAALYVEAAIFIGESQSGFTAIDDFVSSMRKQGRDARDRVVGGIDPDSKYYLGSWIMHHRNTTFHYPKMDPVRAAGGREPMGRAVKAAAENDATIEVDDQYVGKIRYGFADDVVVQLMPEVTKKTWITKLRRNVKALGNFAYIASEKYTKPWMRKNPDLWTREQ